MPRLMHLSMISLIALCLFFVGCGKKNKKSLLNTNTIPLTLKIGHVGHDHHLPLFVALDMSVDAPVTFCPKGIIIKKIVDKKRYGLFKDGKAIATLQIIKVGGGSKMPTALAQNIIDVGYGGTAPVLAAIDKGSPIRLISPLQSKGDMFVLDPKFPANSWTEFVRFLKKSDKPVRIGYKNPIAVAKIIFENALKYEGVAFSSDVANSNVKVQLVNVKGGGKLNSSLANGLIRGYVGNNPFPSIGEEKKILKVICDLEELPPGNFKNHPCCCIAAMTPISKNKAEVVEILLNLNRSAVKFINNNPKKAARIASRWIGTSEAVEIKSVAASNFSMDDSPEWHKSMAVWAVAMNKLGLFKKRLNNLSEDEIGKKAYDFTLLKKIK